MATRTRKTTRRRKHAAVGKKRVHRNRRSVSGVGDTSVGRTRRSHSSPVHSTPRKRRHSSGSGRGFLGATGSGTTADLMNIGKMSLGVAIGAFGTHMLLRPLEHKISAQYPHAAKFMAGAELLIGGFIAVKGKGDMVKSIGVGILANGVHGVMKQLPIGMHSPSETIAGLGEYTTLNVPMSGLIDDGRHYVRTPTVGAINGSIIENNRGGTYTPVVGDSYMGISEEEMSDLLSPKGLNHR